MDVVYFTPLGTGNTGSDIILGKDAMLYEFSELQWESDVLIGTAIHIFYVGLAREKPLLS